MKILYLITQDDLGGAGRYVLMLAKAYQDRAEVAIAVGPDGNGWLSQEAKRASVPLLPIVTLRRAIRPFDDVRAFFMLRRVMKDGQWDAIHANSSKAGFLAACAGATLGRREKPRLVYTAHGWVFLEPLSLFLRSFYVALEWIAARSREQTIVLSKQEADVAKERLGIDEEKILLIPHGLKDEPHLSRAEARKALGISDAGPITIGVVANFYKTKGLDVLLDALREPKLRALPFRLVIVGDGPERADLETRRARTQTTNEILFVGARENASALFSAFDVFVLSSRKEGLPFALLEAIGAGLPIVATSVGGVPETLGDAGILIPPDDADALANAIHALLTNEPLRRSLAEKSLAKKTAILARKQEMLEKTWGAYLRG